MANSKSSVKNGADKTRLSISIYPTEGKTRMSITSTLDTRELVGWALLALRVIVGPLKWLWSKIVKIVKRERKLKFKYGPYEIKFDDHEIHLGRWDSTIRDIYLKNKDSILLVPPFSWEKPTALSRILQELEFAEWNRYVAGDNGYIKKATFLFITWDLEPKMDYGKLYEYYNKMRDLLDSMYKRAKSKDLAVLRYLLVDAYELSTETTGAYYRHVKEVWDDYLCFKEGVPDNYKVLFADRTAFDERLQDIALFSGDSTLKEEIEKRSDNKHRINLPDGGEYLALQYSVDNGKFLYLYWTENSRDIENIVNVIRENIRDENRCKLLNDLKRDLTGNKTNYSLNPTELNVPPAQR